MKIVLGYLAQPEHLDRIRRHALQLEMEADLVLCRDAEVPDQIVDAEIFCGHVKAPVDWNEVVEAGKLKWIQSSAAGLDHCLVPQVIDSSIQVTSASGLFSSQVTETTLALLLGLLRRLPLFHTAQQERVYERRPTDDLRGKKIGIVGFGGNGQKIAAALERLVDSRIWASDFFHDSDQVVAAAKQLNLQQVYPHDQYSQMLEQIDVLIITVGLTPTTREMIGPNELSLLKPGSYIINVGRGEVVQENALIDAIRSGQIGGAGLDVAAVEPLTAESPLWDLENVMITPHIGAQSHRRFSDVTHLFCENLQRYRDRVLPLNLVEKELGFPDPPNRFNPLSDCLEERISGFQ